MDSFTREEIDEPIKPQRTLMVSIVGILDLVIGIFAVFLRERLKSE